MKVFAPCTPFLLAFALLLAGCDRNSQTTSQVKKDPPPTTTPSDNSYASTRPSTQTLLTGNRKSLVLGALPLVLQVPESWNLDSPGGAGLWLEGPAPHGDVRIQLTSQNTPFTAQALTLMEQERKKEAAQSTGNMTITPLRAIGAGAKVLEQREVREGTVVDPNGNPAKAQIMDWTIEAYVPQDKTYNLDLLHFAMLRADQFEQDKDFLEKIIASLRYDPTKGLLQPPL